ncbi:hypothetical protein Slin15195_G057180 [Septoria linicola]|uniref:BTB domain-containing protein n=1 Tax=Septoria linicola TaxID=215465 RepID=A0A9Q9AN75_9PEZI|nr:hypothetical protein Slin14017_G073050 [Septoria linicola]USW52399.1 hypothetical protein Slin15195_G057180 [Septoria linicola]
MAEPTAKKIQLEHPSVIRSADMEEPLPSTPDRHASHKVIDEAIRIKVGQGHESKVFDIHKGLLKHYSSYFRAAVKNLEGDRFAESAQGVISLPEVPNRLFVHGAKEEI